MSSAEFEPAITASKQLQTYVLQRMATEIGPIIEVRVLRVLDAQYRVV
jgi:hypothetical protein